MTTAADLSIVPIEALTSPRDRFHCHPYHTTMAASGCVARQLARTDARTGTPAPAFERCAKCEDGKRVAERVKPGARRVIARVVQPPLGRAAMAKVEEQMSEAKTDTKPVVTKPAKCAWTEAPCGEPAHGGRGRYPQLCDRHIATMYKRDQHGGGKAQTKATKAPAAKIAKAPATAPTDVAQLVARALAVVERLGGVERAERIAEAIASAWHVST